MGMKAVFDTNIFDYLNGYSEARAELERPSERLISTITWTEVMVGARSEGGVLEGRFLNRFRVVDVQGVAALSVARRREGHLKLPDAVVYATAQSKNCLLVTRNTKDFDVTLPNVRIPYAYSCAAPSSRTPNERSG